MHTRTLGQEDVRAARLAQRWAPHLAPLSLWIDTQNAAWMAAHPEGKPEPWMPYLDPFDGGVNARVLLLLESPGPVVSRTRFVSMDNPDGTAENLRCLVHLAGLRRAWRNTPRPRP